MIRVRRFTPPQWPRRELPSSRADRQSPPARSSFSRTLRRRAVATEPEATDASPNRMPGRNRRTGIARPAPRSHNPHVLCSAERRCAIARSGTKQPRQDRTATARTPTTYSGPHSRERQFPHTPGLRDAYRRSRPLGELKVAAPGAAAIPPDTRHILCSAETDRRGRTRVGTVGGDRARCRSGADSYFGASSFTMSAGKAAGDWFLLVLELRSGSWKRQSSADQTTVRRVARMLLSERVL